jgi:hypothetical protein
VTIRILGSLLSSYQQLLEIEERGFLVKNVPFLSDSTSGSQMPITSWPGTILKSFRSGLFGKKETVIDAEDTACSNPRLSRKQRRRAIKSSRSHFEPSDRARALLALAVDLADRLVPAFDTPTSMPYARINLKKGIDNLETEETCAAATTSLTLEFTLLSQLTGNPIYEQVARRSFMNTWDRRIPATGLVGNQIGVRHGLWMAPFASGIGAGIDSFYEYALKGAVLFDDDEYMGVWEDSYRSVMQHVRAPDGHVVSLRIEQCPEPGLTVVYLSVQKREHQERSSERDHAGFAFRLLARFTSRCRERGGCDRESSCVLAFVAETLGHAGRIQLCDQEGRMGRIPIEAGICGEHLLALSCYKRRLLPPRREADIEGSRKTDKGQVWVRRAA